MTADETTEYLKIKFGEAFNQGSRSGLNLFKKALKAFPGDQTFTKVQVIELIDACMNSLDEIEGLTPEEFTEQADAIVDRHTH